MSSPEYEREEHQSQRSYYSTTQLEQTLPLPELRVSRNDRQHLPGRQNIDGGAFWIDQGYAECSPAPKQEETDKQSQTDETTLGYYAMMLHILSPCENRVCFCS